MVGLPTPAEADAPVAELNGAGWPSAAVLRFTRRETGAELESMIENAGTAAGCLSVKVDNSEQANAAADAARRRGATLAARCRQLTVEELI